ncbi:hypothetical protein CFSAN000509_000306 [Salmonella bongori CFSAN000509]|uniref:Uncharacterized protein n=1 Tax=Salmonella enterica TaxID=28901 RepID=A0A750P095_SALER|nr:hypothetical protein [Salmonella bongori CFSAN000509]
MRIVSSHDYHISNYDAAKQDSPVVQSLALFVFCGSPHTFTQRWISARYQKREEEVTHGLVYESRCAMRLTLV